MCFHRPLTAMSCRACGYNLNLLAHLSTQDHCFGDFTEAESSAASKKLFKQYVFVAFMSVNLDVYILQTVFSLINRVCTQSVQLKQLDEVGKIYSCVKCVGFELWL